MKRKRKVSGRTNDSSIRFDEITTRCFFPGAFEIIDSAIALFESRVNSIDEKQKTNAMIPINDQKSLLGILGSSLFFWTYYRIIVKIQSSIRWK